MAKKQSSLGRGLGSLISKGGTAAPKKESKGASASASSKKAGKAEEAQAESSKDFLEIDPGKIQANPYQPRMEFSEAELKELADSIREEGLLQPIVVRKKKAAYILVAGERRMRACQKLKLKSVPVRVVEMDDSAAAVMSLVENLQREDLNPIDEAMGYSTLMREFDLTQEDVAKRVGKPRASVANALRLIQLEQEIQGYLVKGLISVGHAKVILGLADTQQRMALTRKIIEMGMSVREAERQALALKQTALAKGLPKATAASVQSAVVKDLQKKLSMHLGAKVQVQPGAKKGKMVITYEGNEDLNRILDKIGYFKNQPRVA